MFENILEWMFHCFADKLAFTSTCISKLIKKKKIGILRAAVCFSVKNLSAKHKFVFILETVTVLS